MTTTAPGRARSAGIGTPSTKARKTAVPVAAATVTTATRPVRARAPGMVRRRQFPPGTRPVARRPRGARAWERVRLVSKPFEAAPRTVEEDEPAGIDLTHDLHLPGGASGGDIG